MLLYKYKPKVQKNSRVKSFFYLNLNKNNNVVINNKH